MQRTVQWADRFPGIAGKAYLANCSQGPMSVDVRRTLDEFLEGWLAQGNPWEDWERVTREAAGRFAQLIHTPADEVAPTYALSTALSTVLSAWRFRGRRRKIVVTDLDFPTTTVILLAQEHLGARVQTLRSRGGKVNLTQFERAIDPEAAFVLLCHVSSLTGFRHDARAITELAHARDVPVFLDAYQSAGNTVLDAHRLDVDFLATGTQKYLLGVPGSAFVYARRDHLPTLEPTFTGWFSQRDPFAFGRRHLDWAPDAHRLQSGTWGVPSLYAARASLRLLLEVGDAAIEQRVAQLTTYLRQRLREEGLEPLADLEPREQGALVSIRVPDPHGLEVTLRREGIITSARGEGLRFSFHFFNSREDIERGLAGVRRELRKR